MIMSWSIPIPSSSTPRIVTGKSSIVLPLETVLPVASKVAPVVAVRTASTDIVVKQGAACAAGANAPAAKSSSTRVSRRMGHLGTRSSADRSDTLTGDASSAGRLGPAEPAAARRKYGDRVPNLQGDARFRPQLAAVQAVASPCAVLAAVRAARWMPPPIGQDRRLAAFEDGNRADHSIAAGVPADAAAAGPERVALDAQ